jgi:heme iron utilization protein
MDDAALATLRELLEGQRVLSLAVLADGEPAVGMLPFAVTADRRGLLVHASGLARHAKGLVEGGPFDALVHLPDVEGTDVLQIPRVTLRGRVSLLDRESPEYAADRDAYLARFPEAEGVMSLGDFRLYRLEVKAGRLVGGFARAVNLGRDVLERL